MPNCCKARIMDCNHFQHNRIMHKLLLTVSTTACLLSDKQIINHSAFAFTMQVAASQQQPSMSRQLPSIATGKGHPLPNGKGVQGGSLPGTPTEGAQQDSNNGAAGGSRKSPSTIMRPRSTLVLSSSETTRSAADLYSCSAAYHCLEFFHGFRIACFTNAVF